MTDQKNTILAIVLSAHGADRLAVLLRHAADGEAAPGSSSSSSSSSSRPSSRRSRTGAAAPGAAAARPARRAAAAARRRCPASPARRRAGPGAVTREAVLAATPRVAIDTPQLQGLDRAQGRPHRRPRADQVPRDRRSEFAARSCCCRRRAARTRSMPSSAGSAAAGATAKLPDADTVWRQEGAGTLGVGRPVTLTWDNGEGPRVPPHHRGRRQVPVHRQATRWRTRARRRSRSIPMR